MTTRYVYDGGSNTSPYETWAKAATSIEVIDSVAAAGETVYIASDHQETKNGASFVIDFANGTILNPIFVISADRTTGEPPTTYENMVAGGGYIQTTGAADGIALKGNTVVYGIRTDSEDLTTLGATLEYTQFVDCYFDSTDQLEFVSSNEGIISLVGCTLDTPNDNLKITSTDGSLKIVSCILTTGISIHFRAPTLSTTMVVEDSDLTASQYITTNLEANRAQITIRRCALHVDTLADPLQAHTIDHPETWLLIESSAAGTDTDPVMGLNYYEDLYGVIINDPAEYRTGGASDGTTNYSWKMTCNANTIARHTPLKTPPIVAWVTPTDTTLTVYVAHDAVGAGTAGDLLDTECWLTVSTPDEASPATAQGEYLNTLPATILTAASDLTNEGSDEWQDTPTTYQQITLTIAPTEEGPMVVRVNLATGGADIVWVDPKAYVS